MTTLWIDVSEDSARKAIYLVPGRIFAVETEKVWISILPILLSSKIKLNLFEATVK